MTARTGDSLLRIIIVVVAVLLLFPLLMMMGMSPMMGMMGWWWGGAGPGVGYSPLWGLGMMIFFLIVLIAIGYLLYRSLTKGALSTNDRALEELRVAYARGDLSQEEYEERRESLEQSR